MEQRTSELSISRDQTQHDWWHRRYREHPEEFLALPEPISLPTEWPVLAFLNAARRGETASFVFTPQQRARMDDAANWLMTLTGLTLPRVSIWSWSDESLAERAYMSLRPDCKGFCACGEPQLRGTIILRPSALTDTLDDELAAVVTHEAQHGAHAIAANARPEAYLNDLAADVDEMAVGFTEQIVLQAMCDDNAGQIYLREAYQQVADPEGDSMERWLAAMLDLTSGGPKEMCAQLAQLAIQALRDPDEAAVVALLNARSRQPRSAAQWRELLAY